MADIDFSGSRRPAPQNSFDLDLLEDALALLKTAYCALEAVEGEISVHITPPLRTLKVALRFLDELAPEI